MKTASEDILALLASLPPTNLFRGLSRAIAKAQLTNDEADRILAVLRKAVLDAKITSKQAELSRAMKTLEGIKSKEARQREQDVSELLETLDGL